MGKMNKCKKNQLINAPKQENEMFWLQQYCFHLIFMLNFFNFTSLSNKLTMNPKLIILIGIQRRIWLGCKHDMESAFLFQTQQAPNKDRFNDQI